MADSARSLAECAAAIDLPWRTWCATSFSEAAAHGCPVLVLMGDALDAWSWRWFDEIAGDSELITLIEQTMIPIWLDRRCEPGVAAKVQDILAASSNSQGWPACAFFTPSGKALGAIPWSPLRDAERRAGLASVVLQVAEAWHSDAAAMEQDASIIASQVATLSQLPEGPKRSDRLLLDGLAASAIEWADPLEGGFAATPKSLTIGPLRFLTTQVSANKSCSDHLQRSCDALLSGAIYDQLGGGFHRASTNATYTIPFFEKRSGDQAAMALLFDKAADACNQPLYADTAQRILAASLQNFVLDHGGIAHGFHALSIGGDGKVAEGAAYCWNQQGMADIVGKNGAECLAARFFHGEPVSEDFYALAARGNVSDADREKLPALCARLAAARAERTAPWRDNRAFAEDQGRMLQALSVLAPNANNPEQLDEAAARLFAFIDGPLGGEQAALYWDAIGFGEAHGSANVAALIALACGCHAWFERCNDDHARVLSERLITRIMAENIRDDHSLIDRDPILGESLYGLDNEYGNSLADMLSVCQKLGDSWAGEAQQIKQAYRGMLSLVGVAGCGLGEAFHA